MGNLRNHAASAPKLSDARCRAILSDPTSDPEKARLAQEVVDLRQSTQCDGYAIEHQNGELEELRRELAESREATATAMTLLEQARTIIHDMRGAA